MFITNGELGLPSKAKSAILLFPVQRVITLRMEAIPVPVLQFPVIDTKATGENIARLRQKCGLSVRDLQSYFGFEAPQAIYQWQHGQSLPSVDNLYALSELLGVPSQNLWL